MENSRGVTGFEKVDKKLLFVIQNELFTGTSSVKKGSVLVLGNIKLNLDILPFFQNNNTDIFLFPIKV